MMQHIHCVKPDTLELALLQPPSTVLRPEVILKHVFRLSDATIRAARIVKIGYRSTPADTHPIVGEISS
jgi:hypothetical protein